MCVPWRLRVCPNRRNSIHVPVGRPQVYEALFPLELVGIASHLHTHNSSHCSEKQRKRGGEFRTRKAAEQHSLSVNPVFSLQDVKKQATEQMWPFSVHRCFFWHFCDGYFWAPILRNQTSIHSIRPSTVKHSGQIANPSHAQHPEAIRLSSQANVQLDFNPPPSSSNIQRVSSSWLWLY